jgi:hypothetical protein
MAKATCGGHCTTVGATAIDPIASALEQHLLKAKGCVILIVALLDGPPTPELDLSAAQITRVLEALTVTDFREREVLPSGFEPGKADGSRGLSRCRGGGIDTEVAEYDGVSAIADDEAIVVVGSIDPEPLATKMADIRKVIRDHILNPDETWEVAAKVHARMKRAKWEGSVVTSDQPGRTLVTMERACSFFVHTRSLTRKAATCMPSSPWTRAFRLCIRKLLPPFCDEEFLSQFCRGDHQHAARFFGTRQAGSGISPSMRELSGLPISVLAAKQGSRLGAVPPEVFSARLSLAHHHICHFQ